MNGLAYIYATAVEAFLKTIAKQLIDRYADSLDEVVVVMPSRRSGLFLKRYLGEAAGRTIWAPRVMTFEELIETLSETVVPESIPLLFAFYSVYQELEGADAQPFEEFMTWGQQLLNDFNEVDGQLVDAPQLFRFVNETRALELWNPSNEGLSNVQEQYLQFWEALGRYYLSLRKNLEAQNLGWAGLAARKAVEQLEKQAPNTPFELEGRTWKKLIFVGHYALNKAQERILKILLVQGKAEVFWDTDAYYTNNPAQEAGEYFSGIKNRFSNFPFRFEESYLSQLPKTIEVTGVAGNIGQARLAGQLLASIPESESTETVVVLANQSLLVPVLQALPDHFEHVNITMGYPLKNTVLHSLWTAILQLHDNANRWGRSGSFYFRDVLAVLNHPFLKHLPDGFQLGQAALKAIRTRNRVWLTPKELKALLPEEMHPAFAPLETLFEDWQDQPLLALKALQQLVGVFRDRLSATKTAMDLPSLELEYLYRYHLVIQQLLRLVTNQGTMSSLRTLRLFFNRMVGQEHLTFYGEPLQGLQLMGMLETRALDFKNVILLSANEDQLPEGKNQSSFIPYDLRREFALPTYCERDGVYAYHFYRLLQRTERLQVIYNTEPDTLGGGEKSRFITQILEELPKVNPKVKIKESIVRLPVVKEEMKVSMVQKTPEIIEGIDAFMKRGLSPSALNKYVNCPLDFYYNYVAGIRESDEVEETIEASTLGDFVHQVLEDFYTPKVNQVVAEADIKAMLKQAAAKTEAVFLTRFNRKEISNGKNLLTLRVAIRFVETFLRGELAQLKKWEGEGSRLSILALEKELSREIRVGERHIRLIGKADRMDRVSNHLRIIDYKTGVVYPQELRLKSIETIFSDPAASKARQLMMYAYLYHAQSQDSVLSGITSMRKLSEGLMPLSIEGETMLDTAVTEHFGTFLHEMIREIYDPNLPFQHRAESPYCRFCH